MSKKLYKKLQSLLANRKTPKPDIYRVTKKILKGRGNFFYSISKEPYFYDGMDNRQYNILDKEFGLWLSIELGFDRSDRIFKAVISDLEGYAFKYGERIEFKKFSYFDRTTYTLYINKLDGRLFKLDGDRIMIENMGTDNVYFKDPDYYQCIKMEPVSDGLADELLFGYINFPKGSLLNPEEQRFILKWWLHSSFFRELLPSKSIAVFYGPPDSGKTEAAKALLMFLFGSEADVNDPPRGVRDFRVMAHSFHLLFIDDLDVNNRNIESELVRLSTGARVDDRKLYTNSDLSSLKPDAFIGFTTKAPHFTREDLMQRLIVFWLESKSDNISAEALQQQILTDRNKLWAEVLLELNSIVQNLRNRKNDTHQTFKTRNAAWADFVFRSIPEKDRSKFNRILSKLNEGQINFLLESNPLAKALSVWLKNKKNLNRWVESGKLRVELKNIAGKNQLDTTIYMNNQKYGVELKNVASTFSRIYKYEINRSRGRNEYRFTKETL
jgi:hypothetical protein